MEVGILGGTFDPIHLGHLRIAEEARLQLGLGRVLFVPAGRPAFKGDQEVAPVAHRIEMIKLAIAGKPYFERSSIEIDRAGVSYTVDTMQVLKRQLGASTSIFFILGMDSLLELPEWKNPSRLINLCRFAVFPRPGFNKSALKTLETFASGITENVVWLDMEPVDISSTDIRRRVACGLSIHDMVTENVERYIVTHCLYRS